MKQLITLIFLFSIATSGISQFDIVPVFPSVTGEALRSAVVQEYKPSSVLSFSDSRDTLFSRVFIENDSVVCIYTDHKVFLPAGQDPTQAVFMDGSNNGINTEHSFPQAKGASEGNARADMHHLYPSKVNVNSARANDPYMDIPDSQTQNWYYKTQTLNSTPSNNIDAYSEDRANGFEPRETVKGDIARAQMYFYTMYQQEADEADPNYFESQRETLCAWHFNDPVDSLEWERNLLIGSYQGDNPNPFTLDCSLAARMYCPDYIGECLIDNVDELELSPFNLSFKILDGLLILSLDSDPQLNANVRLTNIEGRTLHQQSNVNINGYQIDSNPLMAGFYLITIEKDGIILTTQKVLLP